ncbi:YezD family protein [Nitrospira sp. CMX1]
MDQEARRPYADQEVEQAIRFALKGIRFGSVEITVHDSRVVQIERKEKIRIERS